MIRHRPRARWQLRRIIAELRQRGELPVAQFRASLSKLQFPERYQVRDRQRRYIRLTFGFIAVINIDARGNTVVLQVVHGRSNPKHWR